MSNGAEVVADTLMDSLLVGETFDLPTVNLNDPAFTPPTTVGNPLYALVSALTNENLTTRVVGGTGTYDAIMASQAAHLKAEFDSNRITGAEYTKAYVALAQAAMGQGVQFLLGKDQAYWASVNAQTQALTARVQLETAKAQLAIALIEAKNQRATFALNKIRLANEDAQYGIAKYNLASTLPAQLAMVNAQKAGQDITNSTATYNLSTMLPEQRKVISEQVEAARAQTLDTRSDGVTTIAGSIGKQKALYTQQIDSYKRSSELNAGKVFSDAWIAHKAIDEGITTPAAFNVTTISEVLTSLKTKNNL